MINYIFRTSAVLVVFFLVFKESVLIEFMSFNVYVIANILHIRHHESHKIIDHKW